MSAEASAKGTLYVVARSTGAALVGIATILWGLAELVAPGTASAALLLPFAAGGLAFFAFEAASDVLRERFAAPPASVPGRRDPEMGTASA